MTVLQWINTLVVGLGLPAVVAGLIFVGRKLEMIDGIRREVDENVRPDLKDVRERMASLEGKTSSLFQSHSPIGLTKKGKKFLQESGLREFIDENKDELMRQCDSHKTMATPYDVQQMAFAFFDDLALPDEIEVKMKNVAFNHGVSLGELRRTGGIYFRDICLDALGFELEDDSVDDEV
jgi:hypothetical protein